MARQMWNETFATGIDYVDFEHKRLLELINRIADHLEGDPSAESVADCLGEIHDRVAAHFALEERALREHGFADFAAHKADHERLLDEVRTMMEAFDRGACEGCRTTLDRCLVRWFASHAGNRAAHPRALGS